MANCIYTVPDKSATGDNFYGAIICNQAYVDYFWNTYGFHGNKAYWDDGWGWNDCCNTDKPLARAFNGCYLLTYSAPDYLNESWSAPILNWGRRFVRTNIGNLRSKCGDRSAIARSFGGGLVEVYLGFFYSKDVPGRAETLIHESRHQSGKPHDATFPAGSVFGAGMTDRPRVILDMCRRVRPCGPVEDFFNAVPTMLLVAGTQTVSPTEILGPALKSSTKESGGSPVSVEERVIEIVSEQMGVAKDQVTRETSFVNDLGADSLDTVELVMEFEEEFDITIPDEEAEKIQTVGQAIQYIEEHTK